MTNLTVIESPISRDLYYTTQYKHTVVEHEYTLQWSGQSGFGIETAFYRIVIIVTLISHLLAYKFKVRGATNNIITRVHTRGQAIVVNFKQKRFKFLTG